MNIFPYNSIPLLIYFFLSIFKSVFAIPLRNLIIFIDYIPHSTTIGFWTIHNAYIGREVIKPELYTRGIFGEKEIKNKNIFAVTIGFTGVVLTALSRVALGFALFVSAV